MNYLGKNTIHIKEVTKILKTEIREDSLHPHLVLGFHQFKLGSENSLTLERLRHIQGILNSDWLYHLELTPYPKLIHQILVYSFPSNVQATSQVDHRKFRAVVLIWLDQNQYWIIYKLYVCDTKTFLRRTKYKRMCLINFLFDARASLMTKY